MGRMKHLIWLFAILILAACETENANTITTLEEDDGREESTLTLLAETENDVRSAFKRIPKFNRPIRVLITEGTYVFPNCIVLQGATNVTIEGEGTVRFHCEDTDEDVMAIIESKDITVKNVRMRHVTPLEEYQCHGAVLRVRKSENVSILACELNGCGAVGLSVWHSEEIRVSKSLIHDNSFCAFYFESVDNIGITMSTIINNGSFIVG